MVWTVFFMKLRNNYKVNAKVFPLAFIDPQIGLCKDLKSTLSSTVQFTFKFTLKFISKPALQQGFRIDPPIGPLVLNL